MGRPLVVPRPSEDGTRVDHSETAMTVPFQSMGYLGRPHSTRENRRSTTSPEMSLVGLVPRKRLAFSNLVTFFQNPPQTLLAISFPGLKWSSPHSKCAWPCLAAIGTSPCDNSSSSCSRSVLSLCKTVHCSMPGIPTARFSVLRHSHFPPSSLSRPMQRPLSLPQRRRPDLCFTTFQNTWREACVGMQLISR